MAIIEIKNGNPAEAIQELLHSMLSKELVSAVLAPQEIPSGKTVVQTLVRDPAKLTRVNPLAPVFGVNSARIISQMCVAEMAVNAVDMVVDEPPEEEQAELSEQEQADGDNQAQEQEQQASEQEQSETGEPTPAPETTDEPSGSGPIAVVLKPCEVRAVVELAKLQQVNLDPFLIISVDCWGTYSVQDYAAKVEEAGEGSSATGDFLKQVTSGNVPDELRGACKMCQYPVAAYADLTIRLIGEDIDKQITVGAGTEKGKELLTAMGLEDTPESEERKAAIAKLTESRKQSGEQDELDFLETISLLCINCRNCRAVCPICYCKQCVFDGEVFKYPLEKYLGFSEKRGTLSLPPDKLLFHLTRMNHVAMSCVACGQCEAACPNGIPLGRLYQRISSAAQAGLDYEAGRSLDEELPLTTYQEEELSSVEN